MCTEHVIPYAQAWGKSEVYINFINDSKPNQQILRRRVDRNGWTSVTNLSHKHMHISRVLQGEGVTDYQIFLISKAANIHYVLHIIEIDVDV
jgi:hypothetical protein